MPSNNELTIKNLGGLNLRDAADKVADNEFIQLQNVWQPSKGVYSNRLGTSIEQNTIPLCSRVSGVWRHYSANLERMSIYHCVPDSTLFPDNTQDLVLSDIATTDGNIFGGGAVTTLRVCYSWIGCGIEQTYNSKNRAGFPAVGAFPINAWSNPAHQTITLGGNLHTLRVTVPAFPSGVSGANIFVSRGTDTQMTYVGSVTTSGGSLDYSTFIGPYAAKHDAGSLSNVDAAYTAGGKLKPGKYYVACGWMTDPSQKEGSGVLDPVRITAAFPVTLTASQNSIVVVGSVLASTNGAYSQYVFIGTQPQNLQPMMCAGIAQAVTGVPMTILDIPFHNAQTCPPMTRADVALSDATIDLDFPLFWHQVCDMELGGGNSGIGQKFQGRFGFLLGEKSDGTKYEIFPSRTQWYETNLFITTAVWAGDSADSQPDMHNFTPQPRTQNDRYKIHTDVAYSQPYQWTDVPSDPCFCHHLGLSYFANGVDIPWQTDGYTLGQMSCVKSTVQTQLPPIPRFIFEYQNSLIVAGSRCKTQVYGSNANAPQNWATGGSGTLQRFVTIGDALGSSVSATGIFTPGSDSPGAGANANNPGSFMLSFKKNGTWMTSQITDPTMTTIVGTLSGVGSTQVQVSGRVGCTAYKTVARTILGTVFLGSDANVYLVNRVAEPNRIGNKIQNALKHLVGHDDYMQLCSASFHDNHYKLSYPSAQAITQNPVVNDSELWADFRIDEENRITWNGPHVGRGVGPQVVLGGDLDDFRRVAADSSQPRILRLDDVNTLSDFGSDIVYRIKSKIYRYGSDAHVKRIWGAILDLYIDAGYTNNVLFEAFADADYQQVNRQLSSAGGVWDASQWDQTTYADALWQGFSFLFGETNLSGRTIQFRITKSDQAPFALASITPIIRPEKRRILL